MYPIWYLGERFWLQLYDILRIPSDPLLCDDMFGLTRRVGIDYLGALRGNGWIHGDPYTVHGIFDSYWSRVSPRTFVLPDYIRGVNAISKRLEPTSIPYTGPHIMKLLSDTKRLNYGGANSNISS